MNARMFIYINGNTINKAVYSYFKASRLKMPKVKLTVPSEGILKANQLGGYSSEHHTVYINDTMWGISTEYDKYGLFVHELIHVYQHAFDLCDFDYDLPYTQRPQEIHCHDHVSKILSELAIPVEDSILDQLFEQEAMA